MQNRIPKPLFQKKSALELPDLRGVDPVPGSEDEGVDAAWGEPGNSIKQDPEDGKGSA